MITKEGSTLIVNFMTPGAGILVIWCAHISHIVKVQYFFSIHQGTDQTNWGNSNDNQERVYLNWKFNDHWDRVFFLLGHVHIIHIVVKMQYFFSSSSLLWDIDQVNKDKIMITKEVSINIVISMTQRGCGIDDKELEGGGKNHEWSVSLKSLILRWPLRPMSLLLFQY